MNDIYQLFVEIEAEWMKCDKFGSLVEAQRQMEQERQIDRRSNKTLRYRIIQLRREIVWEDPPLKLEKR
jgi:hypothetical protein